MTRHRASWFAAAASIALIVTLTPASSTVSAQGRDRTAPTTPTNLRVTAFSSYAVSLAWNPSTDNSGSFSYRIQANGYPGGLVTVSQSATSFTFTPSTGVTSGYKYSFSMYAVDAAGNKSKTSNITSTVTLPADRTPPSAPVLSITQVTSSTVSLSWTAAVDDGPYVSYQILMNGSPSVWAGGVTSITVQGLTPSTAHVFSVHGRDNWQNWSPVSNEVSTTTAPSDPNDHTPPTTPTNFSGSESGCEAWMSWIQSTDNVDPQSVIKYEISVNGRLDHFLIGRGSTVVYGDVDGANTFTVVAVDVAGNRSNAAAFTLNLTGCH